MSTVKSNGQEQRADETQGIMKGVTDHSCCKEAENLNTKGTGEWPLF